MTDGAMMTFMKVKKGCGNYTFIENLPDFNNKILASL